MYYLNYNDNEACFLSIYTAEKLEKGGDPFITSEELQTVLNEFFEYRNRHSQKKQIDKELQNFNFEDLQKIVKDFQELARMSCGWLKPCFIVKDNKLIPTYDFFCVIHSRDDKFQNFLGNYTFKKSKLTVKSNFDEATKISAKAVADYITNYYAKKYIKREINCGNWPSNMSDLSYIFKKDLGKALKLEGTKEYFKSLNKSIYTNLG
ncbi:MAG: hypothetical protein J5689_00970, partial [Clostridia bacterium]|nr:hypothetical protein [Clostridia bacterium]